MTPHLPEHQFQQTMLHQHQSQRQFQQTLLHQYQSLQTWKADQ